MSRKQRRKSSLTRTRPTLVLVGLGALLLRVAVLVWRSGNDPFFGQPINDAAVYLGWARAIGAGSPFGLSDAPLHLAPLFPRFVSGLLAIGGWPWAPMIGQALLGTATILGTGLLARRLAGPRAGWTAALVLALCGPLLWYEGWLLPTTLNLFLLTAALNLLTLCAAPGRLGGRWTPVAGLVLGLAAVNRPQMMMLAVFAVIWLLVRGRRSGGSWRVRATWLPPLLLAAGVVAAVAPVTVRNLRASGEPVLLTSSGGLNFYLGNRAGADGRFGLPSGFTPYIQEQQEFSRERAVTETGDDLDWQDVSGHWLRRAVSDRAADPAGTLTLAARKTWYFFSWHESENNFVAGWVHEHLGPGRVLVSSAGVLWLLAVPGMIGWWRERHAGQAPLWLLLAATFATCLLFWVSTRNRLPMAIPLAVFAGVGIAQPVYWKRPVAWAGVALVALLVIWPTGEKAEGAGFYVDLGRIHAQARDPLAARTDFEKALEIDPEFPMAWNGLALTYMDTGERERAISILEQLLEKHPDFEFARRNLEAIRRAPARRPR